MHLDGLGVWEIYLTCAVQPRPSLVDATRISDGRLVYIKRVQTSSDELKIALMMSPEASQEDKRNHSVPILDHFTDVDGEYSYMVMPFLRPIDKPPFETVENVVEFVDQILEVSENWSCSQSPHSDHP